MIENSSEQLSSEIAELNTGWAQLENKNKDLSHRLELLSSLLDNLPGIAFFPCLNDAGFNPVGSNKLSTSNFRLISATNRDLVPMVTSGQMREDFYYRINTVPILMPPLRDRLEDLPLLIDHFLKELGETREKKIDLSSNFYAILGKHHWPGNVRELFNVVRRYLSLNEISFSPSLNNGRPNPTPPASPTPPSQSAPKAALAGKKPVSDALKRVERDIILTALEENQCDMERTAAALGISRRTLQRRVNKHKLKHR